MNELASRYQGFLVGQLLAGLIALMMVLFGDFGGYAYGGDLGGVSLGTSLLASVLVVLLGAGLAVSLYATVSNLQAEDLTRAAFLRNTDRTAKGALLTVAVAALGAVVFVVLNLGSDYWWFDMGFYGAIIGGALVTYLARLVRQDVDRQGG